MAHEFFKAVRPALDGDLTVRAPVTDDPLGTIAALYNHTLQGWQQLITQVQATVTAVSAMTNSSGQQITTLADQISQQLQGIQDVERQVQAMQVQIMAAAVSGSADQADQNESITAAITQAATTRQQGDTAMDLTITNMYHLRDTVTDTTRRVQNLVGSSQKIARVVQLVSNFASQTNLLSLNASLEANRAGEYGRGFALVAEEVRSLARQSATATVEIEKLVLEIQSETAVVATAMHEGLAQVTQGTSAAQQAQQQWIALGQATGTMQDLLQNLTETAQEQKAANSHMAQEVATTIHTIAAIAEGNSHVVAALGDSLQELFTLVQTLQGNLSLFKVDDLKIEAEQLMDQPTDQTEILVLGGDIS